MSVVLAVDGFNGEFRLRSSAPPPSSNDFLLWMKYLHLFNVILFLTKLDTILDLILNFLRAL